MWAAAGIKLGPVNAMASGGIVADRFGQFYRWYGKQGSYPSSNMRLAAEGGVQLVWMLQAQEPTDDAFRQGMIGRGTVVDLSLGPLVVTWYEDFIEVGLGFPSGAGISVSDTTTRYWYSVLDFINIFYRPYGYPAYTGLPSADGEE